jgi:hypothetical protein
MEGVSRSTWVRVSTGHASLLQYARDLERQDRSWATVQATQRHFDRDNRQYLRAERREKGSPDRGRKARKARKRRSERCRPSSSESRSSSERESSRYESDIIERGMRSVPVPEDVLSCVRDSVAVGEAGRLG